MSKLFPSSKVALSNLNKALHLHTLQGKAETVAPLLYYAITDRSVPLKRLAKLRDDETPELKGFKSLLLKCMPVSWDKNKEAYVFSDTKHNKLVEAYKGKLTGVQDLAARIIELHTTTSEKPELTQDENDAKNIDKLAKYLDKIELTQAQKIDAILHTIGFKELSQALEAKKAAVTGASDNPAF